jgi:hypothetical protein
MGQAFLDAATQLAYCVLIYTIGYAGAVADLHKSSISMIGFSLAMVVSAHLLIKSIDLGRDLNE